jgi:transposase
VTASTVVLGCDVGKTHHQICAIDTNLDRVGRRRVTNTRTGIDKLIAWAQTLSDDVVLVIDQKASYAALLRSGAATAGMPVLFVTGLQARRAADLTPGRAKTDRIDAQVIAEFGRIHAHRLPTLELPDECQATMRLLLGRDEDLRCDFNRHINRLRDLLVSHCPDLEAAIDRRIITLGVLAVLARWGNPAAIARARTATITATIAEHNPRLAPACAAQIRSGAQDTIHGPGLKAAGELIARLANHAITIATERAELAKRLEQLASTHDDYDLLNSITGLGVRTTTRFIAEVGDISQFPTGGHLASYAGLAPVNRQSGTGLNTVSKDRAGNHRLKNSLFLAAFVATRYDPVAAACYQRQRNRGKHHNAAVIAVARKRCDIIWAVLTNRTPYNPNHPEKPLTT